MDFQTILRLSRDGRWTDDTPVPPEVFGPIDMGEPATYQRDTGPTDEDFQIVLRAVAEPGVSAETVSKHIVRLYRALNEYCLEKYGQHLMRDEFRRLVYKHTGVGV
jgi:hypothetical protein